MVAQHRQEMASTQTHTGGHATCSVCVSDVASNNSCYSNGSDSPSDTDHSTVFARWHPSNTRFLGPCLLNGSMISSAISAGLIDVTNTQTDRQTDTQMMLCQDMRRNLSLSVGRPAGRRCEL